MAEHETLWEDQRLRTPRAAAVAGIVFAVLLSTAYVLLRLSVPADPGADHLWLSERRRMVSVALGLVPFAGIAFLWFIGVVRDRMGRHEDRFFATVFLGSGLLFLALTFVAAAIAGAMLTAYAAQPQGMVDSGLYAFSRGAMFRITNIYAMRMAGVFMMSLGTFWSRTRTMPRWLAVLTLVFALVLILTISLNLWVVLIFPAWVFVVSVYILTTGHTGVGPRDEAAA
jgi:hypothetical protein